MAYLYPRNPASYPEDDGVCPERSLKYRVWYQGKARKIGDLSLEELRRHLPRSRDLARSGRPDQKDNPHRRHLQPSVRAVSPYLRARHRQSLRRFTKVFGFLKYFW